MYTQEQLEGMSDFEIERILTTIVDVDMVNAESYEWDEDQQVFWPHMRGSVSVLAYCNSWADMGPLIEAEKISISWEWDRKDMFSAFGTRWTERSLGPYPVNYEASNENTLRAAVIVYILIKQEGL